MSRKSSRIRINPVKFLRTIAVLLIICCLLVGAGYYLGGKASRQGENTELSAVVVQSTLSPVSQLATVTYAYTELGQYESSKDFYGTKIPFTTSKFIITYEGTIKAGIDMSRAKISVKEKKVSVILPETEIISHEIHQDSIKVFDEKNSVFNTVTVADYASFYDDQKKSVEKKARAQGLLAEARTQAEQAVEQLLKPVLPEGWTVEIE